MLQQAQYRTIYIVLGFVLLGLIALPFDVAIAHLMLRDVTPGELRGIFRRAEIFGHGYGIAAIGLTIFLLDPKHRTALPRMVFNCLAAGLSADLIKVMVWRTRPRTFELLEANGGTFVGTIFTNHDWTWSQLADSNQHSFPSAHTATAVAMAITLSKIYPAARWWFATLAFLCALNRIDGGAHFVSDVCFGAALGFGVTHFCYQAPWVNRFLARWEQADVGPQLATTPELRKSA